MKARGTDSSWKCEVEHCLRAVGGVAVPLVAWTTCVCAPALGVSDGVLFSCASLLPCPCPSRLHPPPRQHSYASQRDTPHVPFASVAGAFGWRSGG